MRFMNGAPSRPSNSRHDSRADDDKFANCVPMSASLFSLYTWLLLNMAQSLMAFHFSRNQISRSPKLTKWGCVRFPRRPSSPRPPKTSDSMLLQFFSTMSRPERNLRSITATCIRPTLAPASRLPPRRTSRARETGRGRGSGNGSGRGGRGRGGGKRVVTTLLWCSQLAFWCFPTLTSRRTKVRILRRVMVFVSFVSFSRGGSQTRAQFQHFHGGGPELEPRLSWPRRSPFFPCSRQRARRTAPREVEG